MKYITLIIALLMVSCSCNSVKNKPLLLKNASDEEINICEYIYNCIIKENMIIKSNEYKVDANLIMEGLLIIASFRDNYSDRYLIKLLAFYIGEAPGEYLEDLIIKRDKAILPILHEFEERPAYCDRNMYKCGSFAFNLEAVLYRIKQQDIPDLSIDSTGDPFSYIEKDKIKQRFDIFKINIENRKEGEYRGTGL